MASFRICSTATLPLTISRRFGSVLMFTWNGCSARTTSCVTAAGADGMAMSTSSGRVFSMMRASSARLPSTGTPWIRSPRFLGSSSTNPTGW